ncbi:MAG: dsDNA nuclease domain-containing protein [Candidatus Thorarchaeota archaeon]|nr:dsDNA nuclease domain-containing protein [Candidatus Thorarchaeota archaeon]
MNRTEHNPEEELSDTAGSRSYLSFDYQSACAAILSLKLVNTPHLYDSLYCEHHDDILLKQTDGKLIAVQVKSRGSTRELLKSNDEEVTTALKNFVKIDAAYPNRFAEFHLVTNFGFWKANKTGSNLPHTLKLLSRTKTTNDITQANVF